MHQEDETTQVKAFDVFRRIVFKLAVSLERFHLFANDVVRARSIYLEIFTAQIEDSIPL